MNYKGVIIEESLEEKNVLRDVKIVATEVEPATAEHKTPWLKQWTLHTVEILEEKADEMAEKISRSIDSKHGGSWYADFKNERTHYVIFRGKVFKVNRANKNEYDAVNRSGASLGIPDYQLGFSSGN